MAGSWRITKIDQCLSGCQRVYTIGYDSQGRVDEVTDRANRRAEYGYDGQGRLSSARDALDVAKGWSGALYSHTDTTMTVTNSEAESYIVTFDDQNRAKRVEYLGEGNPTYVFGYGINLNGREAPWLAPKPKYYTNVTDPLGNLTRYWYHANRRLGEIDPPGVQDSEYFNWGTEEYALEVVAHRRPTHEVTYEHTHDGDRVLITDPKEGTRHVFYEGPTSKAQNRSAPFSRPVARLLDAANERIVRRTWSNAWGFLTSVENGEGEETAYHYDDDRNLSSIERSGVVTTFTEYGEHGHARYETTSGNETERGYDDVGNQIGTTVRSSPDFLGVEYKVYDEDRNVVQWHTSGVQADVTASYRSDHRLVSIERPFGGDTTIGYDSLGRVESKTELVAATETSGATPRTSTTEYTLRGEVAAVTRPNGMRTEWGYDERGRMLSSLSKRGGVTESSLLYDYNFRGQLDSLVSGAGPTFAEFYDYDDGRLSRIDFTDGEYVTLEYDERARIAERRYWGPSGTALVSISHEYDFADRETVLRADGQALISTEWGIFGKSRETFGNGMSRYYYYNDAGTLDATDTWSSDDDYCAPDGRVESSGCTGGGCPTAILGIDWFSETWTRNCSRDESTERSVFDSLNRLASWENPSGTGFDRYRSDSLSNLEEIEDEAAGQVTRFVYNATRNRLLRIERPDGSTIAYGYDAAGLTTSRGGETYSWTAGGRIRQMGVFNVDYDPLGRLREVSVTGFPTPIKRYRFGGDMEYDSFGNPIALDLGRVRIHLDGSGLKRYRHLDQRGNVKFTTSHPASGTAQLYQHYVYGPFGLESIEGSTSDYSHRFAGGMELGGIVLLGARPYDQEASRFLAPDPIPQIVNQYAYAMGNPVDFWDPAGREPENIGPQAFDVSVNGGHISGFLFRTTVNAIELAETPVGSLLAAGGAVGVWTYAAPIIPYVIAADVGIFAADTIVGRESTFVPHALDFNWESIAVRIDSTMGVRLWGIRADLVWRRPPRFPIEDIEPRFTESEGGGLGG